jgi:hypothetical protein
VEEGVKRGGLRAVRQVSEKGRLSGVESIFGQKHESIFESQKRSGDFCLLENSKVIKGLAATLSLLLAAVAERYAERLWVVTMPSGGREFYHGPWSYLSLLAVFIAVAIIVYKLSVHILTRMRNER